MNDINQVHPADIAERLTTMDSLTRHTQFLLLSGLTKVAVFPYFEPLIQQEIIRSLGEQEVSDILNNINPDDRTQLFENFPDDVIKRLINLLNDEEKQIALNLIGYEKDSIARLMTPYYIQTFNDETVLQVLERIKKYGKKVETLNYVYVVDENNKLIDELKIGQLLMAELTTVISELMDYKTISIFASTSLEHALDRFEKYDRSVLPIVTENGTLVGIVTADDIIDKMKERDTEDLQKFGGLDGLDLSYTTTPLLTLVQKRAGWLVILFFGEMFTASAMTYFDAEIQKAVVLALFIPLIISSGGNSGSQAASLIIRALALNELKLKDWWYVMRKEVFSGLLLGGILGVIGFFRIMAWQKLGIYDYGIYWFYLALSIGVSLVFVVLWGTLSGSLIPLILKKVGLDPATASAPFVATLVDVTGLIIYFTVAALFLTGRLL
ncbi:MAG TPA: magnesium transporter [Saprospiraceae bacterium]|nr:magnesium transporter [Saprospiraceae bacterium]HQW55675.1 magnesium transporter [Saprospiraceae bacterium]